jgi:tetratricopeptide (TPR) repeat protein
MKWVAATVMSSSLIVAPAIVFAFPPDPIPDARALFRAKKYDEAAKKLEAYLATNKFDGQTWSLYSECLHFNKQYEPAIAAAKKALECGLNRPGMSYNIACAYALLGKSDEAIDWLKKAFEARFAEQETIEKDEDLESLRKDPRFITLTGLNPPTGLSPAEQWAWDLDFLVRRMEQMHWRLYDHISKEEFSSAMDRLKADAPKLPNDRARARLMQMLARVGDGHTLLSGFAEGETSTPRLPLQLYSFTDGLFIVGAAEAHKELAGAKVLKVGSLNAADALQKAREYCSVDNEMGYLDGAPTRLLHPGILQEIGASDGPSVEFTVQLRDGSERKAKIEPAPFARQMNHPGGTSRPAFVTANVKGVEPLYRRDTNKPMTLENLDDIKAVYFGFHAIAENPNQRFADFVAEMNKRLDETRAESLIIDMRLNGGGNTGLVMPLIQALIKNEKINRPGHLFVIIGRRTFSAAQNTVNMIEKNTNATFVGEPTGSKPNFVGESTYIVLPYSKLRVYCSSRYWQYGDSVDTREWVQPQIAVQQSSTDYFENRDPVLDAIVERIKARK